MKTNHYGEMYFGKVIDVTDPCYDRDDWGRTSVDVVPGTYDCYATHTETGRVAEIFIKRKDSHSVRTRMIDTIGVDAGLAGFFNNKKDYTNSDWDELCHKISDLDDVDGSYTYFLNDGFFSSSGWGDGEYAVFANYDENGEIVGLKIEFINDEDEDY